MSLAVLGSPGEGVSGGDRPGLPVTLRRGCRGGGRYGRMSDTTE